MRVFLSMLILSAGAFAGNFDTLIEQRRAASLVFDLDAARLAYAQACPADRIATFPLQKAALCEHEFGNYVCLHCGRETHVLRETMGRLESRLDPARFLRVHRSAIVNLDRIKDYSLGSRATTVSSRATAPN